MLLILTDVFCHVESGGEQPMRASEPLKSNEE